jgi:chromosome segregation ATPase
MQEKIKLQDRRLAELSELRFKYQEAEQHLQALQKQKVEFDDLTSRQIPQLRTKLETYRTQVVELSAKTSDLEAQLALKEKQLQNVQTKLDDSSRIQKQQDLLLKDLSKSQPISRDLNTLSSSSNVPQPKKSSLANLLHTVDPEAEKKAKDIQDSLLANLNDAKSRLDILEDDVATKQLLIERLQQELTSTKVQLSEIQTEYQSVSAERDELVQEKANLQRLVGSLECTSLSLSAGRVLQSHTHFFSR